MAEEAERVQREAKAEKAEAKEAQRMAEVEEAQRRAEDEERVRRKAKRVPVEAEKKKVETWAARKKQLELLSQRKAAACIAWEGEVLRALEADGEPLHSGIAGYGKGKVPEKRVCMNCLRKGIECEWGKGGYGESNEYNSFLTCTDHKG